MRRRRRKPYTPEERAARNAADAEIRASATELLADPAAVAAMVEHLTTTRSARLLSYSLRNAAMLTVQATQRGITLTDVDSYDGWSARGRQVREGERGLRLVAYKGTRSDAEAPEEATDAGPARRRNYNMTSVFDISQTDPQEGGEVIDHEALEVEPVEDPAGELRANLVEQFERLGYTVTAADQPGGDAEPVVDDQARTVAVSSDHDGVRELAAALAGLLTRPVAQRPTLTSPDENASGSRAVAAPADPAVAMAAPQPLLPLGGHYGTARVRVRTDWDSARTYYTLTAPRVRGTWTVSIANPADTDHVTAVNVDYGEDDGRYYPHAQQRPDRPLINDIPIVSGSHGIRLDDIDNLDGWRINCERPTGRYTSCRAPDRTVARMAAVVRAVLRHFAARPDLVELHRAAARAAAPRRLREENEQAAKLDDQIASLLAEREQHTLRAEHLAGLAIDPDQLNLIPRG